MVIAFDYIRAAELWKVPAGVFSIDVDVRGGGAGNGGGRVIATLPVTPGETLTIRIAENGDYGYTDLSGGRIGTFGGGGTAGGQGTSGAGASSIYRGSTPLVIAGGAGGRNGGAQGLYSAPDGGAGGGLQGQVGYGPGAFFSGGPGQGGSQSAGGAGGGASGGGLGGAGVSDLRDFGTGGGGGSGTFGGPGGGGGGGYYGGGGGGGSNSFFGGTGGGGGGGSSYAAPSASGVVHTQGFQFGYGQVLIDSPAGECRIGEWTARPFAPVTGRCRYVLVGMVIYIMFDSVFYRYDPELEVWQLLQPPPESGGLSPLTTYGGLVWFWCTGPSRVSTFSYDPATNDWTTRPSSPIAKYDPVAARIGARTYVLQGTSVPPQNTNEPDGVARSDSLLIYNHVSNTWTSSTVFTGGSQPSYLGVDIAVLNRRIYVYGGSATFTQFGVSRPSGKGARFNIGSRTWTPIPRGLEGFGVKSPSICSGAGRLWVSGGLVNDQDFQMTMPNPTDNSTDAATNRVMSLAPGESAWRVEASMPGGRFGHASVVIDGLRVAGGLNQRGSFGTPPNTQSVLAPRCLVISGSSRSLVSSVDDTRVRFVETLNPPLIVR